MDEPREFRMRAGWALWILPILALLYFAFVVFVVARNVDVAGVSRDALVVGGLVLFLVVMAIEIPFFLRRKPAAEAPPVDMQDEPVEPAAPVSRDDEYRATEEEQQGLRVLEYSAPAKSNHPGAAYAKAYVPVTKEHVLRIETLAAEGPDL